MVAFAALSALLLHPAKQVDDWGSGAWYCGPFDADLLLFKVVWLHPRRVA
jgi:hypothetical protein